MVTSTTQYRRWRPERFSDLAGQEQVSTTIRQAIMQERVAHGYIFFGPRGTGKTTTARLLARAINCPTVRDGEPCGECGICQSILSGRSPDIIEVDAASNRGIDDIRDLRERVIFAPTESRRKVYIIDEAHMLTDSAANAFLKTLEEPPEHVVFIMCTTELDRIPDTVKSRCQCFMFRRLPSDVITARLQEIVDAENTPVDEQALRLLAREANGSMRDGHNLLEQLVVAHPEGVSLANAEALLGLGHRGDAMTVARHLLAGESEAALNQIGAAITQGVAAPTLHKQVLDLLGSALLMVWQADQTVDLHEDDRRALAEAIKGTGPAHVLRAVKIWAHANLRAMAGSESLALEMAAAEIGQPEPDPPPSPAEPAREPPRPNQRSGRDGPPRREREGRPPPDHRPPPDPPQRERRPAPPVDSDQGRWEESVRLLQRIKGSKFNIGALLRDCDPTRVKFNGDRTKLILPFRNKPNLDRMNEELADPRSRSRVIDAIEENFGERYDFDCVMAGGGSAAPQPKRTAKPEPTRIEDNSFVKAAIGLGARIIDEEEPAS